MRSEDGTSDDAAPSPGVQRLDKWLWYARFFKTRSQAAKMLTDGKVRLSSGEERADRVSKASQTVRVGDILTFPQGGRIRVVKVLLPGTRRGPAPEAATLYEDLSEPAPKDDAGRPPAPALDGQRDPGAGRPTKRERRTTDAWKGKGS